LNISYQYVLTANKANGILGCTSRRVASSLRVVILPLCSTLVMPHLESCVQFWAPQEKREMDVTESPVKGHEDD